MCCIWGFGAVWMVAHRHVHWIWVDATLRQLNTSTHRAFCLGRVMAGEVVEKLAAVWQQCWVTLCYQDCRRWPQNNKLQLSQREERLGKYWEIQTTEFFNNYIFQQLNIFQHICVLELQLSWRSRFICVQRYSWRFVMEVHSTHAAFPSYFSSILKW